MIQKDNSALASSYTDGYKPLLRHIMNGHILKFSFIEKLLKRINNYGFLWSFQDILLSENGNTYFGNRYGNSHTTFKILSHLTSKQLQLSSTSSYISELNNSDSEHATQSRYSLYEGFSASLVAMESVIHASKSTLDENRLNKLDIENILESTKDFSVKLITSSFSFQNLKYILKYIDSNIKLVDIQQKLYIEEIEITENEINRLNKKLKKIQDKNSNLDDTLLYLYDIRRLTKGRIDFVQELGLEFSVDDKAEYNEATIPADILEVEKSTGENCDKEKDYDIIADDKKDFNKKKYNNIHSSPSIMDSFNDCKQTLESFDISTVSKQQREVNAIFESGSKPKIIRNGHENQITCLDFDIPFNILCTAGNLDSTIKIWDISTANQLGQIQGHFATVNCLQLDVGHNLLISGGKDALVKLWDINKVRKRFNGLAEYDGLNDSCCLFTFDSHMGDISALSYDNLNLLTASQDKTIKQWDMMTGKCIQTFDTNFHSTHSLKLEPQIGQERNILYNNSKELPIVGDLQCFDAALATGTKDGIVRLWDLRSGKIIRRLEGHINAITSLKFDTTTLVTGSFDRSIRIWDLRNWELSQAYAYDSPVLSMDFDNNNVISAVGEKSVKVFKRKGSNHWIPDENDSNITSTVIYVKYKDDCIIEGRNNGDIKLWSM